MFSPQKKVGDQPAQSSKLIPGPLGSVEKFEVKGHLKPGDVLKGPILLPSTSNQQLNLTEISQKQHVIVFVYPGDRNGLLYGELAGCTPEACAFSKAVQDFKAQNARVFGLSFQSTARQQEFRDRENLQIEILSDEDRRFQKLLGIGEWRTIRSDNDNSGQEVFPVRTTVIIRQNGIVHSIQVIDKVEGHVDEVLAAVKSLNTAPVLQSSL